MKRAMPPEWAVHDATWIAWPHHEPDWPRKLEAVKWVYAEIVRALHTYERLEILCATEAIRDEALDTLSAHSVERNSYRLHVVPNDRVWLRDSAPTGVLLDDGSVELVNWAFNGWAKYDNYRLDEQIGEAVELITGLPRACPIRDDGSRLVLEGGGIETDGAGSLMVTEEWLLSDVQVRNPGMTKSDYERAFDEWLGIRDTIWLGQGCVGDDTHGHVDDIARFAPDGIVLLAYEADPSDPNHAPSVDNLRRLEAAAKNRTMEVAKLPYPRPVMMNGERLPASYANFYVGNGIVLVPTFNDPSDRIALDVIARAFPDRTVIGIHSVDLVWGLGTLHCLTQQQPAPRRS